MKEKPKLTPKRQALRSQSDKRNVDTPFKAIASGHLEPLRFATEKQAMTFFNTHTGRCLLSFNTNYSYKIIAYKHA